MFQGMRPLVLAGLLLAAAAPSAAQAQSAEAWSRVKSLMEAGPIMVGSPELVSVRLTGQPCNTRIVPVGFHGPVTEGALVQWRALGRATSQDVDGGRVVLFANGVWLGFPPFEAAAADRAAAAFDALVQACETQPLTVEPPADDHYQQLEAAYDTLKSTMEAVNALDLGGRRFTYRFERNISACHFNAMRVEPGVSGSWLEDNTLSIRPGMTFNLTPQEGWVMVETTGVLAGRDYFITDSAARARQVISLLTDLRGLCAEFEVAPN